MCNCSEGIEQRGIEKGRAEGIEIGEARGLQKGRAEGIEEGIEKGIEKGKEALLAAMRRLGADEAMLKKAAEQVN
jgi:flagellar biosynthesis/type III secretory pathway protein FliH